MKDLYRKFCFVVYFINTVFFLNFLPVKVVNPLSILCISFILRAIVKEEINMDIVFCPNPTNKKKMAYLLDETK